MNREAEVRAAIAEAEREIGHNDGSLQDELLDQPEFIGTHRTSEGVQLVTVPRRRETLKTLQVDLESELAQPPHSVDWGRVAEIKDRQQAIQKRIAELTERVRYWRSQLPAETELAVSAKHVVHPERSGKNGSCQANPDLSEETPDEAPS